MMSTLVLPLLDQLREEKFSDGFRTVCTGWVQSLLQTRFLEVWPGHKPQSWVFC